MKYLKNDFGLSAKLDEAALLNLGGDIIIEDLLNEKLKISNYCSEIIGLMVVFMIFDEPIGSSGNKELKKYLRKYKTVKLFLVLDYNKFINATKEEAFQIMKEKYLEGINLLNKQKDFDSKKFYSDVKEVFKA